MNIELREVISKKDLKQFIAFPHTLYKNHPYWVPPLNFDEMTTLDPRKNPASEFCKTKYLLAYRGNEIVGRIAGIINNRYIETWKNKYSRFGWVDFINDHNVVKTLFHAIENWSKEHGMEGVQGPQGFTDFDREGLLIEGFNEMGTLPTIYNYPYYPKHIEQLGYTKEADWLEFEITITDVMHPDMQRMGDLVERRLKLRSIRPKKRKDILPYAKEVFNLLNDAYKNLFGFIHLTDKQVQAYVKQYFSFVNPEFVQIVLDKNNRLAGVGITMPSLSKALKKSEGKLFPFGFIHLLRAIKKNNTADLYLIAVRNDLQGKGVNSIIMRDTQHAYIKHGIKIINASPQLETNKRVLTQWEYYDNRQHKRRRCYTKRFE